MDRRVTLRACVNFVAGTVLVGAVVYFIMIYATAEARVRQICSKITVGMTVSDLNAYAASVGLGPSASSNGTSYVVEQKTFGRYGCRIEAIRGNVQAVKYNFGD